MGIRSFIGHLRLEELAYTGKSTGPRLSVCEAAVPQRRKYAIRNKAYDSGELREGLDECGTKPVIPNRSSRIAG